MSSKRMLVRNFLQISNLSMTLIIYSLVSALVMFLGGGYLVLALQDGRAVGVYILIVMLFSIIQIVQIIRRDRERIFYDQLLVDVDYFFRTGQNPEDRK